MHSWAVRQGSVNVSEDSIDSRRFVRPAVVSVSEGGGRFRLVVEGDVDDTLGTETVDLATLLSTTELVASITLDVTAVVVFGTAGLRTLRGIADLAEIGGFEFSVAGASKTIRRVMAIGGSANLAVDPDCDSAPDRSSSVGLIASSEFAEVVAHGVLNGRDAVVITTPEVDLPGPTIAFVNRAFTDLFGYAADEVIGATPRMLQGPLTDRSVLDRMKDHHRSGEVFEDDLINYTSDGRPFVMSWKVIPVQTSPSNRPYCMSLQREVTDERRRQRFDLASNLLDTQLRIGAIRLDDPAVPIKHTMTTLLSVQTMMLGAGIATVVLTDRNDRDHRFSTAITDTDVRAVDAALGSYGRDQLDAADVVLDGSNPHIRIDSLTVPQSTFRCARLILSGVHRDWLRLADVEYHERLIQRVFSHNP